MLGKLNDMEFLFSLDVSLIDTGHSMIFGDNSKTNIQHRKFHFISLSFCELI